MNRANSATRRTRVLIVDDHPMTRAGLVHVINHQPDMVVCGEAENAAKALAAVDAGKPDLVLADITLPGKSGLELIKDIKAMHPRLPTLVISMHDESLYAERVLRAGARGYITKHEGGEKLMQAIRHVLSGQIYVSEKMSAHILGIFLRPDRLHRYIRWLRSLAIASSKCSNYSVKAFRLTRSPKRSSPKHENGGCSPSEH